MIKHGMNVLRYTLSSNISTALTNCYIAIMAVFFCMQAHPDAQPFKKRVGLYYDDLCIIYGHAVADGRYSLSCFDVDFEYEGGNKSLDG